MKCKKCGNEIGKFAKKCPNCGAAVIANLLDSSIWGSDKNYTDCIVGDISESVKNEIRSNFCTDDPESNISLEEDIIFVRDTSSWNDRNQGLVLTDEKFYYIPHNEESYCFTEEWCYIKNVEYKDMEMFFHCLDGCILGIPIGCFIKNVYDSARMKTFGQKLAQNLTLMAQNAEESKSPIDLINDEISSLFKKGKHEEAYQLSISNARKYKSRVLYFWATLILRRLKRYKQVIEVCNEALEVGNLDVFDTYLNYEKYEAIDRINGSIVDKRKACMQVFQADNYVTIDDDIPLCEHARQDFEKFDDEYINNYLSLPYNERKILVPVREYEDLDVNSLTLIDIRKIERTGINFPIGHPVVNQLYVGHPRIPHIYIPYENYELELLEDKIREFCKLAQSLGAKEISIESVNSSINDSYTHTKQNISGGLGFKLASGSASYSNNSSNHLLDEISKSISLHQVFSPKGRPSLPVNLVWYEGEQSWKNLYEQRMHGSLIHHEERIETRKSRVLESSELKNIKGEFKTLFFKGNANWSREQEDKFYLKENAVLSIKVTFASMDRY